MVGAGIDSDSFTPDSEIATASSGYATREQILNSSKPNWDSLGDEDKSKIRCLYTDPEGEPGLILLIQEKQAAQVLFEELRENLRDEKGERTPNFAILVELGLLDGREKYPAGDGWGEQLRVGSNLLTLKGAASLGIDLGSFSVSEDILAIEERCKAEVAVLIQAAKAGKAYLSFLSGIISSEPELQKACPANYEPLAFLKETMIIMSGFLNVPMATLCQDPQHTNILIGMTKIGWINNTTIDDTRTMSELLTEQGRNRLTAYNHLFK